MTFTKEQLTKIIESADQVITALAGTNDDIHQEDSKKMCDAWDHLNDVAAPPEVVKRLAEIVLAALTAEPAKCGHVNMDCDDGKAVCLSCGKVWEV